MKTSSARFERRLGSIMIGAICLVHAIAPYMNARPDVAPGAGWFILMGGVGLLQIAGGAFPLRALRQWGMKIGVFVWAASFCVSASTLRITPLALDYLIFAIFCLALLVQDSAMKPRAPKHG